MGKDISSIISYDKNGFIIHGKREYLIGGEFHYFRVPAAQWEDRLQKMKATGANLISVYIAWNLHEPEEGKQRWDGDYDLDRFLTLCEKYGFYVLIKPGPYICAELDFGGHPDWLIKKIANKEFRLRMLDKGYLDLCKYWYESCAKQINKHLITNGGNIIAAQIENEYDHLIEYGEETITVDDAIQYFMYLKKTMEDCGIDVPKFANEAEFLRGKGIIDTRTYYPYIPGKWASEFERFEEKLFSSKKTQGDSPVMILELQAGWFSQIGTPTFVPGVDVIEGVSKSVFITGASIVNYYMMVGGTTFPYMGARGDLILGGYGNITSYDFGGAPVGETGELRDDKYHWIKGFIRFAKEFSHLIADSDDQKHCEILSGGENIAVLSENGAELDTHLKKGFENFTTYEEGNADGRFFFVRNMEKEDKPVIIRIPAEITGCEYIFETVIRSNQTRMFPVNMKLGDAKTRIHYSTSELLLTKKYPRGTAVVMTGRRDTVGELCLNVAPADVTVLRGDVQVYDGKDGAVLRYTHGDLQIVKAGDVTFLLTNEEMNGRVEELENGVLFYDSYYLKQIDERDGTATLSLQIKENVQDCVQFFPMADGASFSCVTLDGDKLPLKTEASGLQTASFSTATFLNRPEIEWTSDWKYRADSAEVSPAFDDSSWRLLEKPVSLEEADLFQHGYYWYRTQFTLDEAPAQLYMNFEHNTVDRFLLYINGELAYRTRNRSIEGREITRFVHAGSNTMTILYCNEFHNKSHPHEGAIVKFSGIMHPFELYGEYADGRKISQKLESFRVQQGLDGMRAGFTTLGYDDTSWQTAPDVEKLVVQAKMGHLVWFRRHFQYHPAKGFSAPLSIGPMEADEHVTMYINGKPLALYDVLGPQLNFYIPDSYIDPNGDNVLSLILEGPGFREEIMSGYRRAYMVNPGVAPSYVSKDAILELKK